MGLEKRACHICGRPSDKGLVFLSRRLCPVCERITVTLTPVHPLYPFWLAVMRALLTDHAG